MTIRLALLLWLLNHVSGQDNNCDFYQNVRVDTTFYIINPNYPNNYQGGAQCRWIADCPSGYNCQITCSMINIPQSQSCSMDRLLISRTGGPQLAGAETYCGRGTLPPIVSTGQRLSVGLISGRRSSGGTFYCELKARRATPPSSTCRCGERRQNRIVGGQETGVNEYTMMVGLADASIAQIKCGGAIISEQYVLTAAHCVVSQSINNFAVVVGEHNVSIGDSPATKAYRIERFIIHPRFTDSNYDYDIAIVKTVERIEYNDRVGPACLPFKFLNYSFAGDRVTILGWGTQFPGGPTSNVPMKVDLNVITQNSCRNMISSVTDRQMCTYTPGKDACQDDSGGPLLYTDPSTGLLFSVGVISYGRSCASGSPGINTRITTLLSWIQNNTRGANYCQK